MNLELDVCRSIAGKWGLPLDFVIKEFQVFDVLGQITVVTAGDKRLVFKGGTALNKVYFTEQQRFSEDLDFDLASATPQEAFTYAKELSGKITGFEIGEFRRIRQTVMFECGFVSPLGKKDHVRVDISGKKIATANPLVIGSARSTFTDRVVTGFEVYSFDDLVSRKLNALGDRCEGKDVYDVAMSISKTENIKPAIAKALESEGKSISVQAFLHQCIAKLEKVNADKLMKLTNPLIPFASRPRDWKIVIDTLVDRLKAL